MSPPRPLVVGLISDTHGVLRPEAVAALRGVDRILHAGDVGSPAVLAGLQRVAPVTAVRGNVDHGGLAALPRSEALLLDGSWIYLQHGHEGIDVDPRAAGFRVVVRGHSHLAAVARRDGVLTVNPGSAGPRRFRQPVTLARLTLAGDAATVEVLELTEDGARPFPAAVEAGA